MNKSNFLFFSVVLSMFFAAGLGLGYFLWGPTSKQTQAQVIAAVQATQAANPTSEPQQAADPQQQQVKRYDVPIAGNPVLGSDNAPITIIEFSDYQCPYCIKWAVEVYKPLLEKYGKQIRFVYRDFPLTSVHPEALPAAMAANCAGEQGSYYGYHDKLFFGGYTLGNWDWIPRNLRSA
jgi:protein-disulfide isomerase